MIGKTISHYEILEKLGRGGMGIVYKARDTKLDRILALKFLPQDMSADEASKQRFIQEAKAASALDHPNICTIHDIGETDEGELYIVMAYYEGQTLGHRLEEEEFSIERAVDVATSLARALGRAHEAGIIHRDIKPANIMVTDRGEVKLLDFGLAKLTTGLDLTKEGSTLGTAAYMSPEQARSENVNEGADIWAVGVVLYEMLAGRKPFESAYEQALMYTILNEDPVPIHEVRPEISDEVASVVARCLEKNRSKRFSSMSELLRALGETASPAGGTVTAAVEAAPGSGADSVSIELPPAATGLFSVRNMAFIAAGAVALLVIVLLIRGLGGTSVSETSDSTIAIVPFSVSGSADLTYLGEGMVDLMSEKLDGAGDLRAVNPRVVIALLKKERLDSGDPEDVQRAASLLGAGRYVTGEVLQVGDQMRLTAYVNDIDDPTDPIGTGTFEGTESELLGALDGVATELLSGMFSGPAAELKRAAASSASLSAVKEYLAGEKALREGRNREAAAAYQRAIELDSTFALAYYRNSIAAEWIDAPDVRQSADKAMEFADRLSPQARSLLAGLQLRRNGWTDEAEQAYRTHLGRYLDDIEGLIQLAEILFHENPRKGRSTKESRAPFERVLELEPGNLIAQIHLARLDALAGDIEGLAGHAAVFAQEGSLSERAVEVDALISFATDDVEGQQRVKETVRSSPAYFTFYAVHGVIRYSRNVHGAAELLEYRPSDDPLLLWFVMQTDVMMGHFADYNRFLRSGSFQRNPSWDLVEAYIATSGVLPVDKDRLEYLLERLENADLQMTRDTGFIIPHDDISLEFLAFENAYTRALLLAQLGRVDEAAGLVSKMKAFDEFPGLGSIRADVIAGAEAEIALQQGAPDVALERLRTIRYEIPHAASIRAIADQTRARYLWAELEYSSGDRNVAKGVYEGLDESWSPFDAFYRGPVYLRLAEIAEAEGRVDEAIRNYSLLVEMWKDADPQLHETRQSAQDRLDELLRRRGAEPGELPRITS